MSAPTPIIIKVQLPSGVLVRRHIDGHLSLGDLRALAGVTAVSKLTYTDEEGDAITIASQQDVAELVAFAAETSAAGRTLRVVATASSSPPAAASKTENPWQEMDQTQTVAEVAGAPHNNTKTGWAHNPHIWTRTRQALINIAFVAMFGTFAVKMMLGIVTSIFGIFYGFVCLLLKIVPLCALSFFWFKLSAKKTPCHARSGSECSEHRGGFKRFIRSCFKNLGCKNRGTKCSANAPPTEAAAAEPAVTSAPTDQALLLSRIVGMGFDSESAKDALFQANNELADALQILLSARD